MIDAEESFWSVPPLERKRLWVQVRLEDYPDPDDERVRPFDGTRSTNVQALVDDPPDSEFGFRSLMLFADEECQGEVGVNPLLLDLDLDGDTPDGLRRLLARVTAHAKQQGWESRCYSSGEGFHIEVAPRSVPGAQTASEAWAARWARSVRDRLNAGGLLEGGGALIDKPKPMVRMAGSRNRKGGRKVLAERPGPPLPLP